MTTGRINQVTAADVEGDDAHQTRPSLRSGRARLFFFLGLSESVTRTNDDPRPEGRKSKAAPSNHSLQVLHGFYHVETVPTPSVPANLLEFGPRPRGRWTVLALRLTTATFFLPCCGKRMQPPKNTAHGRRAEKGEFAGGVATAATPLFFSSAAAAQPCKPVRSGNALQSKTRGTPTKQPARHRLGRERAFLSEWTPQDPLPSQLPARTVCKACQHGPVHEHHCVHCGDCQILGACLNRLGRNAHRGKPSSA